MARPLSADHVPSPKGDEGTPLQSLLRGTFRLKEETPLSSLLQAPARLHDPGKSREKTGDDIAGLRSFWQGNPKFVPREDILHYLDEHFYIYAWIGSEVTLEEVLERFTKRLCPICETSGCSWWDGHEIIWKE